MAALETPAGAIGWQAKDFALEDAYGKPFRLSDLNGPSGTLVMFICNHCARGRRPHCPRRRPSAEARDRCDRGSCPTTTRAIPRTHPSR